MSSSLENMHLVLGNQSADMDSIVSSLVLADAYGYIPILNIPLVELCLRKDVLYLFNQHSINPDDLHFSDELTSFFPTAKMILVDHNSLSKEQKMWEPFVERIIDHHVDEHISYPALKEKTIEKIGSCATLVSEDLFSKDLMTKKRALLLLAPILLDTMNLTDEIKTTKRDVDVVKRLKEFSGDVPPLYFESLLEKRRDVQHLTPLDLLKRDFKTYQTESLQYGISSFPKGVEWSEKNYAEWAHAASSFLKEKNLAFLFVLEWLGEQKVALLYDPEKKGESLLNAPSFQQILLPGIIPVEGTALLLRLKEPLARKAFQPLINP